MIKFLSHTLQQSTNPKEQDWDFIYLQSNQNGMNGTIKASNKEFQYNGKSYKGVVLFSTIKLEDLA